MIRNREKIITVLVYALLGVLFIMGTWHAWPLNSVVLDEGYFAGGVLRSLQAHSVLPQGVDVPYGTVTFYASYCLMLIIFTLFLPFADFSLVDLRALFIAHPSLAYIAPRLLGVISVIALLIITERFWRAYLKDYVSKLSLLILSFTTLLGFAIFHTGKVWPLSIFLLLISFMALCKSEGVDKFTLVSIVIAFLAFANFPLMGIALVNIPIIVWQNKGDKRALYKLGKYILFGLIIFSLIMLSNYDGIRAQVSSIVYDYTLSNESVVNNLSIASTLVLNLVKSFRFFPLLFIIFVIALWKGRVGDKRLFYTSLIYLITYLVAISVVARWSTELHSFVRYLAPIPFILGHVIVSLELPSKRIMVIMASLSLIGAIHTTSLLVRPTTYNQARNWIETNLHDSDVVIYNRASPELSLPKNISSYKLMKPEFCASGCKSVLDRELVVEFAPRVIDEQSLENTLTSLKIDYIVQPFRDDNQGGELVTVFSTQAEDTRAYLLDKIADYFDPTFWRQDRLGRNIYVYKIR